jgi:nicotinamidase-related amidase
MGRVVMIIDIQNDYFPGGKMELAGSIEASRKAQQLLMAFRTRKLPVVHIRHLAVHPGASFFLPGTEGAEIHGNVAPSGNEVVVQKHFPNSFRDTALLEYLRDVNATQLVIAGMMTHMCVDSTTRAAFDLGFECFLAHDACATRSLSFGGTTVPAAEVHASFLAALDGMFARVESTGNLLS